MPRTGSKRPNWDLLYEQAAEQVGYFDSRQARSMGVSLALLSHHAQTGRLQRVRRGIFRLSHFPTSDHEDLVVLWLWSDRKGVFSHETALMLHGLSDALPSRIHMTLPEAWRSRRLLLPEELIVHYADIAPEDRTWVGSVPVTTPKRSILDCRNDDAPFEVVELARRQALRRGLVAARELRDAKRIQELVRSTR